MSRTGEINYFTDVLHIDKNILKILSSGIFRNIIRFPIEDFRIYSTRCADLNVTKRTFLYFCGTYSN